MKRLLLLGGGHAHLQVLNAFAARPPDGAELRLVTPHARLWYSGMLPGWVAGHYAQEECTVPLAAPARRAGATLHEAQAVGLDAAARRVRLDDGRVLEYDLLSLDTGGVPDLDGLPGAAARGLALRPIEAFVARWQAAGPPRRLVVVGGGAAGAELALAAAWRWRGRTAVALVCGAGGLLASHPPGVRGHMRRAAARLGVALHERRGAAIEAGGVRLDDGRLLEADQVLLALGVAAPPWLRGSGLALDAQGFVATGATLQSLSHPEVFAAGDVASCIDQPRPRSGVYALRAGAPLAHNLRAALAGAPLQPYVPQRHALNLLSCGTRRAVASWGPFAAEGAWVWRWKDAIDRRFVARHAGP
ncbi:FAD-dependent oxidoreductase [Piscinibacter defluvii]|uniref:FAD-dependent oxidoreductase n=1 Tax=Piscinibacter defluvii TaxID=1796922 RepID=UPI000FDCEF6B|nr:FAD-dependent oxidoreductase [Piscinibacter defluvii]